ncbi:hypothetical protein F4802DRAFT_611455 [Xylaria palmicola]|nr:hypothetical protein F4802DRAFT_611455 [Xylaria palmicola]
MNSISRLYNTLPSLEEANEKFVNREQIFDTLSNLLSQYKNSFGICLIHSHCTLDEGEIMLETDGTSQPVLASEAPAYYPGRWLPSGVPFEFTTEPTQAPPPDLINAFSALTQGVGVLGLYCTDSFRESEPRLEWTESRRNMTRRLTEEDEKASTIETQWNLGRGDPVTMACMLYCTSETTRSGAVHTAQWEKLAD